MIGENLIKIGQETRELYLFEHYVIMSDRFKIAAICNLIHEHLAMALVHENTLISHFSMLKINFSLLFSRIHKRISMGQPHLNV